MFELGELFIWPKCEKGGAESKSKSVDATDLNKS